MLALGQEERARNPARFPAPDLGPTWATATLSNTTASSTMLARRQTFSRISVRAQS